MSSKKEDKQVQISTSQILLSSLSLDSDTTLSVIGVDKFKKIV